MLIDILSKTLQPP